MLSVRRIAAVAVLSAACLTLLGADDTPAAGPRTAGFGPSVSGAAVTALVCDGFAECATQPKRLTIAINTTPIGVNGNICDLENSWCTSRTVGAGPWPLGFSFDCSSFDGSTWFGRAFLSTTTGYEWWTVKVVDRGTRGDEVGVSKAIHFPTAGPCGAGDVPTFAVHAGDFTIS
jgi:hypothetical protein